MTPGPWAAYPLSVNSEPADIVRADDTNDRIATTCPQSEDCVELANALAIAAVPDLIEALNAFLVKPSIGMDRELILAKAALTKAGVNS